MATKKRKSDAIEAAADRQPEVNEIDDEELYDMPITDSCDVIRRKIRNLIDSNEMKVTEFQRAIGTTSRSYTNFMGQNGPTKGMGSSVYHNAFIFFKRRQLQGVKEPGKKRKTSGVSSGKGDGEGKAKAGKKKEEELDLSGINLDGEDEDDVEVYDTCDEIRRKINAYLRKDGVTQASFLRQISKSYHTQSRKIQSKQLSDFRSKKGPTSGNTSAVFYGSYVFFEKLRIKEGKPKSQHRKDMEELWGPEGGMDLKRRDEKFIVGPGSIPVMDKYGQVSIMRGY